MPCGYVRPETLDAALEAIASRDFIVAAGCTDLFPAIENKSLPGNVLDITDIEALRGIGWQDQQLRIGATTTWSEILKADLPPALRGLQLAACKVGAMQIQHRGTLAGNLCNASPAADGVPPLLVCDAEVEMQSVNGKRCLPLADFLRGPGKTRLAPNELLTAVLLPKVSLAGESHFLKLGSRSYLVISIAMTAARLVIEEGIIKDAALAIGACGPVATRLAILEQALIGRPPDIDLISDEQVASVLSPIDDARANASYRAISAAELLRRTIATLAPSKKSAA